MTLSEFSKEFDILYNNIASGAAPGLNNYEKSLLLTNAQESIVKAYYSGSIQKLIPSFEEDERKRRELSELVATYTTSLADTVNQRINSSLSNIKIHPKSVFFNIPCNTWYITHEQAITIEDPCTNEGRRLKITPIKHDYYNTQIDNPFRMPNKKWAWRLDIESDKNNKVIEVLYLGLPITSYYMRYVHAPCPIILVNLDEDPELLGLELSIRGENLASESKLESIDKEIIQLAVDTAILRYRENSLQNIKNF